MKNLKLAVVASFFALAACGTGPDPKAGVTFRLNGISTGSSTANTTCQSGGLSFVQADEAKLSLENKAAPSNAKGVDVTVYQYTVDYSALDGGPALKSLVDVPVTALVPANGVAELQAVAFSEEAKKSFFNATTNTTNFFKVRQYDIHYTVDGKTEYGDPVQAQGDFTLRLGNTFVTTCK